MTYTGGNTTGFASPAGDSLEGVIDLSEALDLHRPSRYPVRVGGDALTMRGILPGDILIIDAALPPVHGRVAVVTCPPTSLHSKVESLVSVTPIVTVFLGLVERRFSVPA